MYKDANKWLVTTANINKKKNLKSRSVNLSMSFWCFKGFSYKQEENFTKSLKAMTGN